MTAVLAGIRVIDITNVLAGPFCSYQLALSGAEVIKVEVPEDRRSCEAAGRGCRTQPAAHGCLFLAQNGGKKSITLNLKLEAGREIFRRLVKSADVVVENFRPGVMDRLGVGYKELSAINPRLIYCAISGFGQDGPMSDAPAYDQIVQGMSGAMSITGDAMQRAAARRAIRSATASAGSLRRSRLRVRSSGGSAPAKGRFIDVSMLDSTIATMGWVVSNFLIAGKHPEPMGNENFTAAPSGTFKTGNGLLNIAANTDEQFAALARTDRAPGPVEGSAVSHARAAQAQSRNADAADRERSCASSRPSTGKTS